MNTRRFLAAIVLACGVGLPSQAARADLLFSNPLPFDLFPAPRSVATQYVDADDSQLFRVHCSVVVGWYDAEHFLQLKNGRLLKVSVLNGASEPVYDQQRLASALDMLAEMRRNEAGPYGPAP